MQLDPNPAPLAKIAVSFLPDEYRVAPGPASNRVCTRNQRIRLVNYITAAFFSFGPHSTQHDDRRTPHD
ncbi:hypothetical protein E2C01_082861 [Portunus trituberculatus]|uniref:Uncharacterized protein n=1 Tax=Portunus trituberculatus TaxID=210409 RepID=A0A5B7J679_PORTR|nr:hypothetical protein [Portunus trituberculatus]